MGSTQIMASHSSASFYAYDIVIVIDQLPRFVCTIEKSRGMSEGVGDFKPVFFSVY